MRRVILLLTIALALFIPSEGCYAHGPWRGKVIEAETKKPIEGAVVVAVWYSKPFYPWAVGGTSPEPMKVVETVTNADGEFSFSSRYFLYIPVLREVSGPDFLVYKPGYDVFQISYVSEEHPLYKNGFAVIKLLRLEKREDRLKALHWADSLYPGVEKDTPILNQYIKEEHRYLFNR